MAAIRIKRGTRAQLNTAATASELVQGEPYLITDENALAVGLTASTYRSYDLSEYVQINTGDSTDDALQIAVVSALPGTPDSHTLYFVT